MALTKTTELDLIQAWTNVPAATLAISAAEDIHLDYDVLLYIEVALIEAAAYDAYEIIIEISHANDYWQEFRRFSGTAETPATTKIADNPLAAAASVVNLDDSATGDFNVPGRKWFIKDGTMANSESVKTASDDAANEVTLCQDVLREHAVDSDCYDRVDEFPPIAIPFAASYVRVLVNNVDAANAIAYTVRKSGVLAMS